MGSRVIETNISVCFMKPIDFSKLFTNSLFEKMVLETNRYAENKIKDLSLCKQSVWNN